MCTRIMNFVKFLSCLLNIWKINDGLFSYDTMTKLNVLQNRFKNLEYAVLVQNSKF